jgi:putative transferase (TIGR04331 family)
MTKNLTTYLPIEDLSKEREYVYFGAVNGKIQNFLKYSKFNFSYGFTSNTKKERIDALKYCDSFTDKIIQSLTKNLNMIHGTQYSEKIWKVIFGRWLKDFIYICYFNFNHLEKLNNDYNFEKIFSLKYLDKEFVSSNSNSLVCLYLTPEWNSKLSTKILEFIGKKKSY